MIIRPFNLTRSLVNRQAYSQAYINRPFQTLSMTLGPHPSERTAWKQDLPLLPELQKRAAQVPGPGPGLSFPLQPRQRRPDIYIDVEAALLEEAALQ